MDVYYPAVWNGGCAKKNCAAGMKRDTSFPDLRTVVQAFVNLVRGTSLPSTKDAMDIDQIGEKESEEGWEKKNWWGDEWGGETQDDLSSLNSLNGKEKGPKRGATNAEETNSRGIVRREEKGKAGKEARDKENRREKAKHTSNGKER